MVLRSGIHGHSDFMSLFHFKFNAWVDVAASQFLDPDRNDTARWNDPRLLGIKIGRNYAVPCQFPDSQWDAVEENVRSDTSDDTISNAERDKVSTGNM
jgi:hypothetical protein